MPCGVAGATTAEGWEVGAAASRQLRGTLWALQAHEGVTQSDSCFQRMTLAMVQPRDWRGRGWKQGPMGREPLSPQAGRWWLGLQWQQLGGRDMGTSERFIA